MWGDRITVIDQQHLHMFQQHSNFFFFQIIFNMLHGVIVFLKRL